LEAFPSVERFSGQKDVSRPDTTAATGMPCCFSCPVATARKRNPKLSANLSEHYIGNVVLRCNLNQRLLPYLFIKLMPIPNLHIDLFLLSPIVRCVACRLSARPIAIRVSVDTRSTPIMFITAYHREFGWQGKLANNPAYDRTLCPNTLVCIDDVLPRFHIEDDSSARRVFIFDVQWNHPGPVKLTPKCDVALGVPHAVAIGFAR
jgi:hypothetical protein